MTKSNISNLIKQFGEMTELAEGATPGKRVDDHSSRGSNPLSAMKNFAVADAEVAVPYNLQSAVVGLNSSVGFFSLGSALDKWC